MQYPCPTLTLPRHAARKFYRDVMKCEEGRSSKTWIDYSLYGHQIVSAVEGRGGGGFVVFEERIIVMANATTFRIDTFGISSALIPYSIYANHDFTGLVRFLLFLSPLPQPHSDKPPLSL